MPTHAQDKTTCSILRRLLWFYFEDIFFILNQTILLKFAHSEIQKKCYLVVFMKPNKLNLF